MRSSWHICDELAIIVSVHNGDDVIPCILLDGEELNLLHFRSSLHFSESIIRVGLNKIRIKRIKEIKKMIIFESVFKISNSADDISIFSIEDRIERKRRTKHSIDYNITLQL